MRIGSEPRSDSDLLRERAAWRDAGPATALLVVTQGSLIWLDPDRPTTALGVGWALSPLIAVAWLAWNQLRTLRRADEFQRVVHLEAVAIAFGALIVLLAGVGVLHAAGIGDITQQTQVLFGAGVLVWVAALAILSGRSR